MKKLWAYRLYIIGFAILATAAAYLNFDCPPNYDEAHAWNIARYLSPAEIFTISKTEGHPFLWYYMLMPFAKTGFFYPYSLYLLNLIIILGAFFCLYKYAPLPSYAKCLVTLSAPFLQLYSAFSRSYSLTILLLFALLSLYPRRHCKTVLYPFLLLLLANTNLIGLIIAVPFGSLYLYEAIKNFKTQPAAFVPLLIAINFILLELVLLLLQFYGFDRNIPHYTPIFRPLREDLNRALYPLNIWSFAILAAISLIIFYKRRRPQSIFFFCFTAGCFIALFGFIYHGAIHHHLFFYVCAIAAFWLAGIECPQHPLPERSFLPLSVLAFLLIFNPYAQYKQTDCEYLQKLRNSAESLNRIFPTKPVEIYVLEHFDANIIHPYLNDNIILLNQTLTDFTTLKAFQESLYNFYMKINRYAIIDHIRENPGIMLYRTCGEPVYHNMELAFQLKQVLAQPYCLYSISIE